MALKEERRGRWQQQHQLPPQGGEQGLMQQKDTHSNQHQQNLPQNYSCRPPRAAASSDPCCQTVPSWEEKFCTDECRIPWWKIVETKKLMAFMYAKVVEWDDSAGAEAFRDAKCRYWAKINGLPCDIPLPDPDMYIDTVDHDACIHTPELAEGLDKPSAVTDDEASDGTSFELDSFPNYAHIPIPVSGWGDAEDPVPVPVSGWGDDAEASVPFSGRGDDAEAAVPVSGWGDKGDPSPVSGWGNAEYSVPVSGWGDAEDLLLPTNGCVDNEDAVPAGWNGSNGGRRDRPWKQLKSYVNGRRGRNGKKRVDGCQYGSRFGYHRFNEHSQQENC